MEDRVSYCGDCLGLNIRSVGNSGVLYCNDCGGCDIREGAFDEWDKRYRGKYRRTYIGINSKEEDICQIEKRIKRLKI